jgi:ABC-type polar amino acid transport system ATPase subunit
VITAIELENARLFEGGGWRFDLSPLTVLCGTNSAGKSTVLKTLLLLRQTLGIREVYGAKGRLRFVGSQVDLGNYRSFVSHNQVHRDLSIGLTFNGSMPRSLLAQLQATEVLPGTLPSLLDAEGLKDEYTLRCVFTYGLKPDVRGIISIEKPQEEEGSEEETEKADDEPDVFETGTERPILKSTVYELFSGGVKLLAWTVSIAVVSEAGETFYRIAFPRSYLDGPSGLETLDPTFVDLYDNVECPTSLRGSLPDRIFGKVRGSDRSENPEDADWRTWPLPPHMERALRDLRRKLSTIQYLGPLRAAAKRYYTAQVDPDTLLDPAGELLPYLLRDRGEMLVWNRRMHEEDSRKEKLTSALNYWLYYIRTGKTRNQYDECFGELSLENTQELLIQLAVRSVTGTETYPLLDSGFGYSQLLPILARGLITNPGSTFIIEQPEVHLNPSLQVRLTDFLVAMSRAGKQMLVETHSEHIVNAVRALAAEDVSGITAANSKVMYIEATSGRPKLHELSVGPDGSVPGWPKEFFGEAASLVGRLFRAKHALSPKGSE